MRSAGAFFEGYRLPSWRDARLQAARNGDLRPEYEIGGYCGYRIDGTWSVRMEKSEGLGVYGWRDVRSDARDVSRGGRDTATEIFCFKFSDNFEIMLDITTLP